MNLLFPGALGFWSPCVDASGWDRLPAGACLGLGHACVSAVLDTDRLSAPHRPDQCTHTLPSDTMEYTGMLGVTDIESTHN